MSNEEFLKKYYEELVGSKTLVIINIDKEDMIHTYHTSASQLTSVGMLEVAKKQILEDMEAY
jgi:hypothetical protein